MSFQKISGFCIFFLLTAFAAPGWAQSEKKQPLFGESLCADSNYHCLVIEEQTEVVIIKNKQHLDKTKKIQTVPTWEELWPNENEREIVMKINRLNIKLSAGMTIAVPNNMAGKTFMDFSPFPLKVEDDESKLLVFDPVLLAWAAYDETGKLVRWGPAVGGKKGKLTIVGNFQIIRKAGPKCRSGKYNAPMPWAMFFSKAGYAFHGSPTVPGKNASHGCVRLFTEDAKWLSENFVEVGTLVIINPYPEEK